MPKKIVPKDTIFSIIKIAGGLLTIGIIAVSILLYVRLMGPATIEGASLSVDAPPEVMLGSPFEFRVNISNNSNTELRDVELKLFLPDDIASIEKFDQGILTKEFGIIQQGEIIQETFILIALRGENAAKDIDATLVYTTKNVSSRFSQEKSIAINVADPALRLDAQYPNEVLSGEEFNVDFTYINNSDITFDSVTLELEYPQGLEVLEASRPPLEGNNIWTLDAKSKNTPDKITILSRVFGKDGSFYNVVGKLIVNYQGNSFPIDVTTASFAIANSPLSINLRINGQDDYVAEKSDGLNYTITYTNNTDVGLKDVIVKAQLIGEMYDITTLRADAFFESTNNTITWNASRVPGLQLLPPGETKTITFSINTNKSFPIRQLSDKNYILKLVATIESPTVPFFVASKKTSATNELETKISGELEIDAQAYFRDAESGILNKGPLPPRVNVPTEFTIHWLISTRAVDVKNIELRAFLQSGVRWTGNVKSNVPGSVPVVNERTSEVVWSIDEAYANKGIADQPLEAIFQVEATPSLLEEGMPMPLLSETTALATDIFTNTALSDRDDKLTSRLPDDPTVLGREGGEVVR